MAAPYFKFSRVCFPILENVINDFINPSPDLNTTIFRVTDANNKNIEDGGSTKSTTVKFYFKGYTNSDEDKSLTFECKMDQESISSCIDGEVYPNLRIDDHWFRVKVIGKDGLSDVSPDIFSFNIITSVQ